MAWYRILLSSALLCIAMVANGQYEYFDSIYSDSKALQDDSLAVNFIINNAKTKIYKDRKIADTLLVVAVDRAVKSGDRELQAHVYTTRGQLALIDGRYEDATLEIGKSNQLIRDQKSISYDYLVNLNILGLVSYYQGDYKKALPYFFERIDIAKSTDNHAIQLRTLNNIGICYKQISDNANAFKFYNQALQIVEDSSYEQLGLANDGQRQYYLASINSNIGIIQLEEKSYDDALKSTKDAYAVAKRIDNKPLWCDAAVNLSKIYRIENSKDSAAVYIEEAVELAQAINEPARIITTNLNLAIFYNQTNRSREGVAVLHDVEELSDSLDIKEHQGSILEELSKAYHEIGDGDKAYSYNRLLLAHRDSIYSTQSLQISKELNQQYETAEKEKEIAQQQKLIAEQKNRILLFFISMLALIMALLYFWNRYNTKQKLATKVIELKERQIENLNQEKNLLALDYMLQGQEEERKRIAQDLHDGLGGLLARVRHQIVSIQNQITVLSEVDLTQEAERLITKACDEVRRISHEMMPASLISLGLIEAIEDTIAESQNIDGLQISLDANHDFQNMDDKTKVNLYRIVQEVINNTHKHAKATSLDISLHKKEKSVELVCIDNGIGFNPDVKVTGLGLKGIAARVSYLNGDYSFVSAPGEGSKISVEIFG